MNRPGSPCAARCGVLLFATAIAGPIGAAMADGEVAPAAKPQQLEEIIVTAQKVQQTLEQVPASVSAVDGDTIRTTGVRNFDELQNYTANTNLQVSPSSTQLLIRGFGTLNDVPGLDPSVGVIVDGVVYTYPEYLSAFFGDFQRYEVLRGPQGTLFGKNVTAGLLNITTNPPDENANLLHWELEARSNGNRAFRPVFNLRLGSGMALRFSGNFEHGDRGLLYNTDLHRQERNVDQDSGRLRFRYDSGEGWTLDAGAFLCHISQNFNAQQLFIVKPAMAALDRSYDPDFSPGVGGNVSEDVPSLEQSVIRGLTLSSNADLGAIGGLESLRLTTVSSLAENVIGARDIDADFSPVPFIHDGLVEPEPERQFTQEIRVAGKAGDVFGFGGPASFVGGLYYDNYTLKTSDNFQIENLGAALAYITAADEDSAGLGANPAPGGGIGALLGGSLDNLLQLFQKAAGTPLIPEQTAQSGLLLRTEDYAVFGQGEWYFLPQWSLIAGLRYALEDRNGQPHSFSNSLLIEQIAKQQNFSQHLHRVETDLSPKLGVKWQAGAHTEAYFTWAQGYKSGGFNGIPLNPQAVEYQPEKASSFEAGFKIKDELLGSPIRGNIALYHTRFENLQVSTFEGTNVVVVNAAQARSQGFESDVTWLLPLEGWSVHGSFGLADARYTYYPNGPPPGDYTCAAASLGGSCPYVLTGHRLPFAPDWTASTITSYTTHLPYAVSATGSVDVNYQGSRFLNPSDDPREYQHANLLINPHLVFASEDDRGNGPPWALILGVENLTKQIYGDQIIDQPLGPGNFAMIRGDRGRVWSGNFYIDF